MAIEKTLKDLDFTDKEIKVYLCLMKNGRITPTVLSKLTKINRATVYTIARSLQLKGVASEDVTGKITYFSPLEPEKLERIIERPRRELIEQEGKVKKAIAEISLITPNKNYSVPRVQFIQEENLENFLYENTDKWLESIMSVDGIWWGFQDHSLLEEYKKWIDWYWKKSISQKCKLQVFSNNSKAEDEINKKISSSIRNIRFLKDMTFTSSVWIGGEYLIMICTRQHPFYLFEIHDKTLADNMRVVFKNLWGVGR